LYALAQRISLAAAFCSHVIRAASAGPTAYRSSIQAKLPSTAAQMIDFRM
jgi:hypothetical protein